MVGDRLPTRSVVTVADGERLIYHSEGLPLPTFVWSRSRDFLGPIVVWSHGSKGLSRGLQQPVSPGRMSNLDTWLSLGCTVAAPVRRGYDGGAGETLESALGPEDDPEFYPRFMRRLYAETGDLLAAEGALLKEPWVKDREIIWAGYSLGAITSFLAAPRLRRCSALALFAFGAILWAETELFRGLVERETSHLRTPTLMIQAANDYSLGAAEYVADSLDAAGVPCRNHIFPALDNTEAAHVFCAIGAKSWRGEVHDFLRDHVRADAS
jgi:hypothetical protein